MKILIIKFRNIGDVLLTGPLASTLKLTAPEHQITVLVKAGTEAMLNHHPHIDEVITLPKRRRDESKADFRHREQVWLKQLKARGFELMINTTEGDRGTLIGFFTGIKKRLGAVKTTSDKWWRKAMLTDRRPMSQEIRHTVIRNLDLLPDPNVRQHRHVHLGFSDEDMAVVEEKLKQQGRQEETLIQVHPTSRWFFKCWDNQAMAQVIDHLYEQHNIRAVLTSGPDERELEKIAQIIDYCRHKPYSLAGALTLSQTAALSSLCRMFIGADTAPMHMAAALNVPVIGIFGPSGTFDWGPWPNGWQGSHTPYPNRNGIQHAGPHTVIQKDWHCVPCGRDGCGGSKRSRCLDEISAGDVIHIVDQRLQQAPPAEAEPTGTPTFETTNPFSHCPLDSTVANLLNRAVRYYLRHSPITEGKRRLLNLFRDTIRPAREKIVTDTKHGFKLLVNLDNPEHERIYFYQDHDERYEVNTLQQIILKGDTCWDIGANIGFYSCLLADKTRPGNVIAFEPSPSTMRYLKANAALNCFDNITLVQKALGDEVATLQLNSHASDLAEGTASLKPNGGSLQECVEVETVDRLVEHYPRPDFIKIDVESYEVEVIRGAAQTLHNHSPMIMIEVRNHDNDSLNKMEQLFQSFGYQFFEFQKHSLKRHERLHTIRRRNVLLANPDSRYFSRLQSLISTNGDSR